MKKVRSCEIDILICQITLVRPCYFNWPGESLSRLFFHARRKCHLQNRVFLSYYLRYLGDILAKVHVQNQVFDYVPPDLVNLFISNM